MLALTLVALPGWLDQSPTWANEPTATVLSEAVFQVTEQQRSWWAFQAVRNRVPPVVENSSWPQNEIDQFILAELEARGRQPTSPADRRTWLRRATLDLTGLPPTQEDVGAFLADDSSQAFAKVVDQLLASPAYGQRWARHWLDVVRYADFYRGDPNSRKKPDTFETTPAWRYRDWVVASLNGDLPFNQFIVHQIAGDLLPSPHGDEIYPAGLIATTFLSNGVWDFGDADKEKIVSDMADDNIDTIGKAFLGLTLGCARCHDHKYDPISQQDYYGLAGVFYSTHFLTDLGRKGGEYLLNRVPLVPKSVVEQRAERVKQLNETKKKLAELEKREPQPADDDPERLMLVAKRDKQQSALPPEPPRALAAQEGGTPGGLFPNIQDVPIHVRGSYTQLGPVVPRRLPEFFAGESQTPITGGSGRRQVANWVASTANPLTTRVIVNRVWHWHFGAGLVRTPSNFGTLSELPTHPALLDWLAVRFVEDGWSLKQLHRRIMLSATYQQSSVGSREQRAQDPDNRWLGRFASRRLEAEPIRDAMLVAAGRLDPALGGPAGADLTIRRRSLYVQTARWKRSSYAMLFDAANPDASTEKRHVSTVAPQSLFLLNNDFPLSQAGQLAQRLIREVPSDAAARIQHAYQLLFARPANSEEVAIARQIVASSDGQTGWEDLAHVLLCSNEFVYLD